MASSSSPSSSVRGVSILPLMVVYGQILLLTVLSGGGGLLAPSFTTSVFLVGAADPSAPASVSIDASGGVSDEAEDEDLDDDEDDDEDDGDDESSSEYIEFGSDDEDGFIYYAEDFQFGANGTGKRSGDSDLLHIGMFILSDFVVAGSNLAGYNVVHPPFELFEDFDIGSMVRGGEMWMEMVGYRKGLERPSLSWYVDKVARKRWLGERRYPQPNVYFMCYKDELVPSRPSSTKEEDAAVILQNLPTTHGYAAKPTHMSLSMGNWLVDLDPDSSDTNEEDRTVRFTKVAKRLTSEVPFDPAACADSLAEGLQRGPARLESWALKMVRPGLVVEELYSNHRDRSLPPDEFCVFVIWGKVYAGVWNTVQDDRFLLGTFYRNGQAAPGCSSQGGKLPDWVPWQRLVAIAESLGSNKDMIRIDMFVGVPRYSPPDTPPMVVVSESELHPTTIFCNPYIADEMARLWVAGYKVGNYKTIPNREVPKDFVGKAAPASPQ
jgi:hypothetical protein